MRKLVLLAMVLALLPLSAWAGKNSKTVTIGVSFIVPACEPEVKQGPVNYQEKETIEKSNFVTIREDLRDGKKVLVKTVVPR